MWRALGTGAGWKGVIGQDWSGRASRVRLAVLMRPQTLEGYNFFVRTPIRVFLDAMENPLSQESIHIELDKIGNHIRSRNHEKQ